MPKRDCESGREGRESSTEDGVFKAAVGGRVYDDDIVGRIVSFEVLANHNSHQEPDCRMVIASAELVAARRNGIENTYHVFRSRDHDRRDSYHRGGQFC